MTYGMFLETLIKFLTVVGSYVKNLDNNIHLSIINSSLYFIWCKGLLQTNYSY